MSAAARLLGIRLECRQVQRDEVEFSAMMRVSDGHAIEVRVVNLSANGFMARTEAPFAADAPVCITLPRIGQIDARIAWALGGRIGGQFAIPLAEDRYAEMLAACRRPAGC
jgi:hypothetical protein